MPATPRPWDGDLPALAVPDLLWGDGDFCDAVYDRVDAEEQAGYEGPMTALYLRSIHAEMRARAGGG
jgi:hypothetical protein